MNQSTSSRRATRDHTTAAGAPSAAWNIALWVLQVLLAAAFLFFGGSKLAGTEQMVAAYEHIGIGQWFRYVTGLLEMAGAALLLIPALAGLGGVLLACVMAGAAFTHLFVIGGSPLIPFLLLALASAIAWGRWRRTLRLARRWGSP